MRGCAALLCYQPRLTSPSALTTQHGAANRQERMAGPHGRDVPCMRRGRAPRLRANRSTRVRFAPTAAPRDCGQQPFLQHLHRRIGEAKNPSPYTVGGASGSSMAPTTAWSVPSSRPPPPPQPPVASWSPPRVPSPPRHSAAVETCSRPTYISFGTRRCGHVSLLLDGRRGNLIKVAPRQEVKSIVTQALQGETWNELALEQILMQMDSNVGPPMLDVLSLKGLSSPPDPVALISVPTDMLIRHLQ